MHLYKGKNRSVYAFNAVDVEINGQLQHGFVVDVTDGEQNPQRLVNDFECAGQDPVLVEYGKVYDCSEHVQENYPGKWWSNEPAYPPEVEVLLRDHPDHPWKWYPGKILPCPPISRNVQVVVEAEVSGYRIREMLPYTQIRMLSTAEERQRRQLASGHFYIDTSAEQRYLTTIAREESAGLRSVLGGPSSRKRRRLVSELWQRVQRRTVANAMEVIHHTGGNEIPGQNTPGTVDCKKNEGIAMDGLILPWELLVEIFLSLKTHQRQRCRRVCALWEEVITSQQMCADIRVNLVQGTFSPRTEWMWQPDYAVYSSIFKHLSPATRTISLRDGCFDYDDSDGRVEHPERYTTSGSALVNYITRVLTDSDVRIQRLILWRRWWSTVLCDGTLDDYFLDIIEIDAGLASCCDRVIWYDYFLRFIIECKDEPCPRVAFRFPFAVFHLASLDAAQVWNIFEDNLYSKEPLNLELIAHWTAERIKPNSGHKCRFLIMILDNYQSCDPRPSTHYRRHKWTTDNLQSLEVSKLNKISLHALSSCMYEECESTSNNSDHEYEFVLKYKLIRKEKRACQPKESEESSD
ncbi:uncharacterized protein LOC129588791 [Paramacrobiotus metropolitanus]|uniref:uncharacterized protein LOC129588791 n=1 Tax=Paramacrobiotus metropolitanus TaxID=2943436 RepID=UPI0024461C37|nr:uncharacterized protein LOC129588791 [Paramacrobiotus metropolitanus]